MSNTGENAKLIERFKNVMDRQPLAGNGADGNFSLHNDWKGWWNKLFMPVATEAATALAKADARIGELEASRDKLTGYREYENKTWREAHGGLKKALDTSKARAETAETLLEEARRALEPFIRLADNVFSDGKNATVADEVTLWCFNDTDITFGDLRRARATLDRIGK